MKEEFQRLVLGARYGYENMTYDRNALLEFRKSLVKDRVHLHRMVLALIEEVRYPNRCIRDTGGEIPLTGYSIGLSLFASTNDSHRDDYRFEKEGENDYFEDFMRGRNVGEQYFKGLFNDYENDVPT